MTPPLPVGAVEAGARVVIVTDALHGVTQEVGALTAEAVLRAASESIECPVCHGTGNACETCQIKNRRPDMCGHYDPPRKCAFCSDGSLFVLKEKK